MAAMPNVKSIHLPTFIYLIVAVLAILGVYHLIAKK